MQDETQEQDMRMSDNPSPQNSFLPIESMDGDVSIDSALLQQATKPQDETALKKKKTFIKYGSIAAGLTLLAILFLSAQSAKGPVEYGVCATFLEMHTPYPPTLNFTNVEGSRTSIRIYYTSIDPFGQYKMEMIECKFRADQWELLEVYKNRRPVEKEEIAKFNKILPTLLQTDLYLNLPPNWKNPSVRKIGFNDG